MKSCMRFQKGAVSLLTAVVLLFVVSLVGILTARSVRMDTQISADNYRANQAFMAASAAMDRAVARFIVDGLDKDASGSLDFPSPVNNPACPRPPPANTENIFQITAGNQTTYARFDYDNTLCGGTANNMSRGMAIARGWSDDCLAVRVITQCLINMNFLPSGKGPDYPLISKGGVGAFGAAKIINRYFNSNIWTGEEFFTPDAAFSTFLRPKDTEIADYTSAQLLDINEGNNTEEASDRNSGLNFDVVTGRDSDILSKLTSNKSDLTDASKNQFFSSFFDDDVTDGVDFTKQNMIDAAQSIGRYINSDADLHDYGLMWFAGDLSVKNNLGSLDNPVVLIVDGDLDLVGNITVHGVLYTTGKLTIGGNAKIIGSVVSESTEEVKGAGNPTLVFRPFGEDGLIGSTDVWMGGAVMPGSWKDWL